MKKETKKNDQNEHKPKGSFFETLAAKVTTATGSTPAILIAFGVVVVWAATGPLFHFSETWQLVINTSTTIVTFLMVFVLQNSQNRDGKALQAKIDELILTSSAQNKFVGIEKLDEEEIRKVSQTLSEKAEALEDVADEKRDAV